MTRRKKLSQAFPQHRWKGVNPMVNENKSGSWGKPGKSEILHQS